MGRVCRQVLIYCVCNLLWIVATFSYLELALRVYRDSTDLPVCVMVLMVGLRMFGELGAVLRSRVPLPPDARWLQATG